MSRTFLRTLRTLVLSKWFLSTLENPCYSLLKQGRVHEIRGFSKCQEPRAEARGVLGFLSTLENPCYSLLKQRRVHEIRGFSKSQKVWRLYIYGKQGNLYCERKIYKYITLVNIMIKIPLQVKLKRETHRKVAHAQDMILKEVYSVFDKAVLHGGTAIWRCYDGKRLSEDLDFYLTYDRKKVELLSENLKKAGFKIKKMKMSQKSIYSELEFNGVSVRLEATFQKCPGTICDYEMSDGNSVPIYSLTPESFIIEKSNTYLKRLKIRDLWDVFFLLKRIENPKKIKEIGNLIKHYKNPLDEGDLKVILLEGIVPSANEMIDYIKRKWENKYI